MSEVEVVAWVSTEERLPEVGRTVAVIYAPSSLIEVITVAHRLDDECGEYWWRHEYLGGRVTRQKEIKAWSPLPPFPGEWG